MSPRVITRPLGGSPLSLIAVKGRAPDGWYEPSPHGAAEWKARAEVIRGQFAVADWLGALSPAFAARGRAAERLAAVASGRGVVVTTGQQPGLFGGPLYTLSKAITAVAFAEAVEKASGIPVAPVFWAATDDSDFREASSIAVALPGGAEELRAEPAGAPGLSMAATPMGDLSAQLSSLLRAAGSTADPSALEAAERAYRAGATVGGAYVCLLRDLLEPLGVAVLDAAHPAVRTAALPTLSKALERADEIATAIARRDKELGAAGFSPQVQAVAGLSLVFQSVGGDRKRIPIKAAGRKGATDTAIELGPNVLLRPVVERSIMPTVAYLGGPAEIAYFAQLGPISEIIRAKSPLILPRWSCTIIEPHVDEILARFELSPDDFRDPHAAEGRVARSQLPAEVVEATRRLSDRISSEVQNLSVAMESNGSPLPNAVVEGLRVNLAHRIDRFERRMVAAAKRRNADIMRDIGTARGSLYPLGKQQERGLSFIPFMARYGAQLTDKMLAEAKKHAARLIGGNTHDG
ncbi:MAG TPA: bacillithiol biosynthesis cysteine-adding enzyme BshC [Gemmatimonadaceae bacterium]|nr:bacillithiol biosynthesis cysteine-adding enzyme BshC [Gemmatimonadaceae bacterium]